MRHKKRLEELERTVEPEPVARVRVNWGEPTPPAEDVLVLYWDEEPYLTTPDGVHHFTPEGVLVEGEELERLLARGTKVYFEPTTPNAWDEPPQDRQEPEK